MVNAIEEAQIKNKVHQKIKELKYRPYLVKDLGRMLFENDNCVHCRHMDQFKKLEELEQLGIVYFKSSKYGSYFTFYHFTKVGKAVVEQLLINGLK